MIKTILSIVIQSLIKFAMNYFNEQEKQKLQSQVAALIGRQESIENSYNEQEKAKKDAEAAKNEVEKQGNDDDVFGANDWNN